MPHEYPVKLTVLSITPTRDNVAVPSLRLPDKHSRLFCGKTLDEWTMIQLWSSKSITHSIFVCETLEHAERLGPLARQYGVELMVRPEAMLHRLNDSGSIPIFWAYRKATRENFYTLLTTPFVVAPCRPPGFFDDMVEFYCSRFGNPDFTTRHGAEVLGGYPSDITEFETVNGVGKQRGTPYINLNPEVRITQFNHWLRAAWYYEGMQMLANSRHDVSLSPVIWEIEPWMDIHIDTEEQWQNAEYWFEKKILSLGDDPYRRYRETWFSGNAGDQVQGL